MDTFAQYADSDDDSVAAAPAAGASAAAREEPPLQLMAVTVNAAPDVGADVATQESRAISADAATLTFNPTVKEMSAAVQGPMPVHLTAAANLHRHAGAGKQNAAGISEVEHLDAASFREQHLAFENMGFAQDPTLMGGVVGDATAASAAGQDTSVTRKLKAPSAMQGRLGRKRRREQERLIRQRFNGRTDIDKGKLTEEQRKFRLELGLPEEEYGEEELKAKRGRVEGDSDEEDADKPAAAAGGGAADGLKVLLPDDCRTRFHGKSAVDYQGRSWVQPPNELKPGSDHPCYVPKKLLFTYRGHTKGVSSIDLFPQFGHLLISGSMDTKIKIWDVYASGNASRSVKRTCEGHTAAVREVKFSPTGAKFSSASYDSTVKIWDVETGSCVGSVSNGRTPYCCTFYPPDENIFMVGNANRRVMQYDLRAGTDPVLEYNYHMDAVNTVTMIDDNKRMVTTSDDKKMLVWDWNIPVPIKYLSDPEMHAIPSVTKDASGKHLLCQSMDNTVTVYDTINGFRPNRRKRFTGHLSAGYACQVGIAPNGQFVASGDGQGRLWFWDWRNRRVLHKEQAHAKGPCIGCVWHPIEPSMVATCGWDGLIKLWGSSTSK